MRFILEKNCFNSKLKTVFKAFTSLEALIVLMTVGIAVVTITAFMNNAQDKDLKKRYFKAYSSIQQAYRLAAAADLIEKREKWNDKVNHNNFLAVMTKLQIVKSCVNNNAYQCWKPQNEMWWGGHPSKNSFVFVDNFGTVWSEERDKDSVDGGIMIDTNAEKGPNVFGKDRFYFDTFVQNARLIEPTDPYNVAGIPTQVSPPTDNYWCGAAVNCYYTSWLSDLNL